MSLNQFKSIYLITLPKRNRNAVLLAVDELNKIEGIEYALPNYYQMDRVLFQILAVL